MAPHHSEGSLSHDSNDESDYHEHETRTASTRAKAGSSSNSKKKPANSRRTSQQADDALHFQHDDPADPQNARKMQNRLAQREFRARRLEHIKELEARVEFLSKPQSEQTEILVAIIHGLMDENKQLRGSLKTMANFVSSGVGGFTHAIRLPEYDNALDLVNRGDRALLLKLVQEKGGLVGAGSNHADQQPHNTTNATSNSHKASPSPPASASGSGTAHADKKRKSSHDTHTENSTSKTTNAKAPRTRSQNARGRQETTTSSNSNTNKSDWQHNTPRDTPPIPAAGLDHNLTQQETQQHYEARSNSQNTGTSSNTTIPRSDQGRDSRVMDMFPSLATNVGPLASFDIFGDNTTGQSRSSNSLNGITSNAPSAFGQGGSSTSGNIAGVKQEESPPLVPYQDPASAWMNAYTNLTPMGGNESFWSLTSSAMNQNAQAQQQPQDSMLDSQDGRNSASSTYNPTWNMNNQTLTSNNLNSFTGSYQNMHHQQQQPLHGYA